ncbi:hypothetical protein TIFTF001_011617 [Ficus carica]|uniref:Uncharacterized protein n=1 Tax=Ficus carica TaxID=3494 RepID=A0AA88AEG4_FICCA|nr:hypothetical protein TIFTF001_011617 [Ficus carica]
MPMNTVGEATREGARRRRNKVWGGGSSGGDLGSVGGKIWPPRAWGGGPLLGSGGEGLVVAPRGGGGGGLDIPKEGGLGRGEDWQWNSEDSGGRSFNG